MAALVASLVLSLGSPSGFGPYLVALFVLTWGYGAFCEGVFNGQTPGKRALGVRVVSERGVPITAAQAVLRNLAGALDGPLPFVYLPGLASMLLSRKFQRLGDLAAGTMVVVEQRRRARGWCGSATRRRSGPCCRGCRCGWRPGPSCRGPCPTTPSAADGSATPVARRWPRPGAAAGPTVRPARGRLGRRRRLRGLSPRLPGGLRCLMRVADRLSRRSPSWRELDELLEALLRRRLPRARAAAIIRLGELYRAACTDLMLAESHDLPRETVAYLHALVGRAHNAVYQVQGFKFSDWSDALFGTAPRQLRRDPALRVAAAVFFGSFLLCALLAAGRPGFAARVVGEGFLEQADQMFSEPLDSVGKGHGRNDTVMTGFYIQHNASIGLQCFAWGLAFGLGSLYQLLFNGITLGVVFGHMATSPSAANFFPFVTAHGPFELSAIVFSGAAGLRLGSGLIDTKGQARAASLRREARRALPIVGAAVVLFVLAAFLEGYVSASPMTFATKAAIALICAGLLVAYVALGGRRTPGPEGQTEGVAVGL